MHVVNYHRHSHISNIYLPDSVVVNEDYAKRCVELGHKVLSSCEHGTQGNYREAFLLAQKYGLKWRYVAEAYFVKDRTESDATNAHLVLAAKTEKGVGDLNEILSEANLTGYYYRPRVDIPLLMGLNPKDVFVTSSCIGGVYKYGLKDAEWLIKMFQDHFRDSFMLEIQAHNTDKQKAVNKFILEMYRKYGIPLIAGMDSHFIYPEQKALRDQRLEANHIKYEDEDGWYMDYPDVETFINRFKEQGDFSQAQIEEAIENTNVFLDFEDIVLDRSKKMPPYPPNLSQEEKNSLYKKIVYDRFDDYTQGMSPEEVDVRKDGIQYEVDTIVGTNTSDYFLLNHDIIKRGKEKGGMLTLTGRGSAPSYLTNSLLGFSSIDRFAIPVTMYPDRFISADRILSGSLPDIDFNCGDVEPFIKAQEEVIGKWHSAPMVAFGTLQRSSAWKMYCRAVDVPFEISNAVSDRLKAYELAVKHAEEGEEEDIDIADYVDKEFLETYAQSENYRGIIDSVAPHPCAHVLSTNDVRREFGIYRINSGQGKKKKVVYAAFIDGATAEAFGYLKNDLLAVDVVKVNALAWKRIGETIPPAKELLALTKNDKRTWDIYSKGLTMGLNQVEKDKATEKVKQYKPRNITELSAFVAGIRPSFQSMLGYLLSRTKFAYNIPALDKIIQTEEMGSSFLIYQEQLMTILQYGGFTAPESYSAIKAISKKHPEKVKVLKERFLDGFSKRLMGDDKSLAAQVAVKTTEDVWQIISDSCSYGFNASHAVSVALDSLYGAYTKAHYPYEYYTTMLDVYSKKGNKVRLSKIKDEMRKGFGISIVPCKFRQDNRDYYIDKENHSISDALSSLKFMNKKVGEELFKLGQTFSGDFIDLLVILENNPIFDSRRVEILIKMGYFREYGSKIKLLTTVDEFRNSKYRYTKSLIDETKNQRINILKQRMQYHEDGDMTTAQLMKFETEIYGMPLTVLPKERGLYCVLEVDSKYSPKIKLYSVATGNTNTMKVLKKTYNKNPLEVGDAIIVSDWQKKPSYQFVGGKMSARPGVSELWMNSYSKVV